MKRLKTDYLDLYLLHWQGSIPFAETLEAFTKLRDRGSIGTSASATSTAAELAEARALRRLGFATNQVLYNLEQRGIEWDLLPWCRKHDMPVMAYSPLGSDSTRLRTHPVLEAIAARRGVTAARMALAWVLREPDVIVIPKAVERGTRARQSRRARRSTLEAADLAELERTFPPPRAPRRSR